MNDFPKFALLLNQLLTKQDRSPAWLARRLGVNGGTVSRWLNAGTRPGSPEMVARIADVLGVTAQRAQLLAAAGYGYVVPRESEVTQASASLHGPAPTAQALRWGRGILPQSLTPFIGRRAEVAQLVTQLHNDDCRLLTLVGPGGVGKTRLAVEVASELCRGAQARDLSTPSPFADGCCYVSLLEVNYAQQIASVLASALGLTLAGQAPVVSQVLAFLRNRRMVLILDNFEHLRAGVAVVTQILAHVPNIKVLVTSRMTLGVPGEWLHPVEGLAVPDATVLSSADLANFDAVRLFEQSARRASPHFDLHAEVRHVYEICRAVEGLPLALELAAAWLYLLPCARVAAELEENLAALASPLPNAPSEHRSMSAVLTRSWQMLSATETAVMQKLALFQGGFDEEAAHAVADADLMTLAALTQKSMLRMVPGQRTRYAMHEMLRQFALEQATTPDAVATGQTRHSHYYLRLLERYTPQLLSVQQPLAMAALDAEYDNVRAAWLWATEQRDYAALAAGIPALYQFCSIRGYVPEGLLLFEQIMVRLRADVAQDDASPLRHLLGHVLMNFGSLYVDLEDTASAIPLLEESLAYVDESRLPYARAWVLARLGYASTLNGDLSAAEQWLAESLALSQGCESIELYVIHRLSALEQLRGNYAQSGHLAQRSLHIARTLGRSNRTAHVLHDLATVELKLGQFGAASEHWHEALAQWRALGNRQGEAQALHGLGKVAWLHHDEHEEASVRIGEALALFQSIGHEVGIRDCLTELAALDAVRPSEATAQK